jgi:hypothetical protein
MSFHINTHSIIYDLISTYTQQNESIRNFFLFASINIERKKLLTRPPIDLSSNGILPLLCCPMTSSKKEKRIYIRTVRKREKKKESCMNNLFDIEKTIKTVNKNSYNILHLYFINTTT